MYHVHLLVVQLAVNGQYVLRRFLETRPGGKETEEYCSSWRPGEASRNKAFGSGLRDCSRIETSATGTIYRYHRLGFRYLR